MSIAANKNGAALLGKNFYAPLPVEAFPAFVTMGPPRPPMRTLRELRTERPQVCQRAALGV